MSARLVWSAPHGHDSPDALVIGESGGSGGYAELFAITAGPPVRVKRLAGERLEGVHAKAGTEQSRSICRSTLSSSMAHRILVLLLCRSLPCGETVISRQTSPHWFSRPCLSGRHHSSN